MKCIVCQMPQPGPHKMDCQETERDAARSAIARETIEEFTKQLHEALGHYPDPIMRTRLRGELAREKAKALKRLAGA